VTSRRTACCRRCCDGCRRSSSKRRGAIAVLIPAVQRRHVWLVPRPAPPLLHAIGAPGFDLRHAVLVIFGVRLKPARLTAGVIASLDVLGGRAGRKRHSEEGKQQQGSGHEHSSWGLPDGGTMR